MRDLDPVLAQRIKELRISLNMVQGEFATKLGVVRTQIVAWEKGERERPSFEKILEMAELAPSKEQRMWFRQKAGVNLDQLRKDFDDERHADSGRPRTGELHEVPLFDESSFDKCGALGGSPRGFIPVPSSLIENLESIFWLSSAHRPLHAKASEQFVLINRETAHLANLWKGLTAVFFSWFPVSDEILTHLVPFPMGWSVRPPRTYVDPDRSKSIRDAQQAIYKERDFGGELEKRTAQRIEDQLRPGILIGWLKIGSDLDGDFSEPIEQGEIGPWRLALEVRAPWSDFPLNIALSEWKFGRPPNLESLALQDFALKEGVYILGQAIGWLGSNSSGS